MTAAHDPLAPPAVDRFGTPGTPTATRVMLLGSGELGKEVTIALQRLGVEVVAVDRYDGAPAHQVAHRAHTIDMTDADEVRRVVELERPEVILPEIEAIATAALAQIEQDGLARVVPTARAVRLTMDREGIRRLAAEELGLPTSRYAFASSLEELQDACEAIGFPCLVKPTMSSSGKGQSTLHGPEDIEGAWQYAQSGARVAGARVIVESFVDFEYEITLLTVRSVDPETGRIRTDFCEPIGHRQERGDYVESWQPQAMTQDAYDSARSVAARITGALGGVGVFGVELFVNGVDVYFSEVSPRPHDTGLVTLRSQVLSEFEMHARAVLGLPVVTTMASPGASAVIYGGPGIGEGRVDAVGFEGVARALAVPEVDVRLFGKPSASEFRRMGVAVATAEDVDGARQRAREAASRVTVVR
ncbi:MULTISPECIES: formate-dependent phosphoribosylglycinamide formyltransferase [Dietzia]|uniref:Formate-dependent phosphoribosylglycinamide formyltransferase n=1 Tax=Dietzia cinnamea TaxID=321318 RepID=A0ABV3YEQ9_9ACTN|nr:MULTISPECIES: formate-dependent phosphoribosylglycinamide formyltransferase [Dietzia]KZO59523.1 phosphoribosylglycinamide formyltransferase [Dietzia maris]MCT1639375.1 formate-dependent phosphoribosylglycinamide formyltransferase [Dietzia cinnamea]MCT1712479.1 formate-dependent phosphoribosylglycinamide formyltransferase [Dietzia cinnamea]MCT2058660.1 formate-dependent phosphoribosylglycinamide formyltransferase [Dietzia cinnamea]MCT2061737.1 formate-dependent phosphoribosylglycinamide form